METNLLMKRNILVFSALVFSVVNILSLVTFPQLVYATNEGCCVNSNNFCLDNATISQCSGNLKLNQPCSVFSECSQNKTESSKTGEISGGNYGLNATAGAAGIKTSGTVAGITGKIIGVVLSLVGIAFFLLMLYGGFLWMMARGDETQAKKARDIIIDAVIGIIIVAAAGIITSFVFSNVVTAVK
ncbi:MAG: hypothetical protein HY981_04485 [Candidatus Magasanikbacteria bacterium]|nr:hypothetical protein [Candidatus Magasanikbacteria bacterium]